MSAERIVITGTGCLSAAGAGMPALWQSALDGAVRVKTRSLPGGGKTAVYAVEQMPVLSERAQRLARRADRAVGLALAAADEAWRRAELDRKATAPERMGLVVGSSRGPVMVAEDVAGRSVKKPTDSIFTAFSSISGALAAAFDLRGGAHMTSATCISGAVALKTALQAIRFGELDVVLVGGVDAPLVDSLLEQFMATGVLASESGPLALRPFDHRRTGTVLGEGAAFVVLERESLARRRGVETLGVLHGVEVGCDAGFRTGGEEDGTAQRLVLERSLALLPAEERNVGLIHLHGTGTVLNDLMESRCVHAVFGSEEKQPRSWATKPLTGHTLGASALFQVVLTLEALRHGIIPGTANCFEPDPACPVRLGCEPEKLAVRTAVCLTSGFWGNTSCLTLEV